ncbi:hypothetical protein SESBI_38128 [Sesbania bispinosa]|nr:hypothetical protein SESBI_38128 [Sesbania bispinosa]
MATDDLVVTSSSSVSSITFLIKLRIPHSELEERVISIGKKETSLNSSSALTNGLGPFLKPAVKEIVPKVEPTCMDNE